MTASKKSEAFADDPNTVASQYAQFLDKKRKFWRSWSGYFLENLPHSEESSGQSLIDHTKALQALLKDSERAAAIEHLYSALGHLDAKASGLLAFHALCLAAVTLIIQTVVTLKYAGMGIIIGSIAFIAVAVSLAGSIQLLLVLGVRWSTTRQLQSGAEGNSFELWLLLSRAKRTYALRIAWALSFASIVLSSAAGLLLAGTAVWGLNNERAASRAQEAADAQGDATRALRKASQDELIQAQADAKTGMADSSGPGL